MRSSKNRSRSKQNRQRTIGNIINRVFDSSGPEGKVRGTPQQIIDKYLALARDAQLSNDRVAEQNFLQHAEHYTRMLGEAQAELAREQALRQQHQGQGGNGNGHQGQRDRDYRGDREDDETGQFPTFDETAEQPDIIDTGIVETPEMAGQHRREERREGQPRREDRGDRRDDRGERREDRRYRDDRRNERRAEVPIEPVQPPVAEPLPVVEPEAAGPVETPEQSAPKPSRSRSKPKKAESSDTPADAAE